MNGNYTAVMVRGRRAGIAAALAVVAIAAVTAGCGGGTSSSAIALDPVAAAATKTQSAGAAHLHFAIAIRSPQLRGKTVKVSGSGAIDGTSSELTIPLSSLLTRLPEGVAPNIPTSQLKHATLKEIAVEQNGDYLVYLNLGALSSQLSSGKQWIELNLSKLGKSAGFDLSKLMSGSQFQPGDLLSMLKSEGATVHRVGPATIDGTATTHYRVSVDMAKALQQSGLSSNPALAAAATKMKSLSENVWIGKDGLLRQVRVAYGLAKTHVGLTMNLSDYGAHLPIAAPPSDSVYDATQLAQGLGSLS
jgi:hypothetical protein